MQFWSRNYQQFRILQLISKTILQEYLAMTGKIDILSQTDEKFQEQIQYRGKG